MKFVLYIAPLMITAVSAFSPALPNQVVSSSSSLNAYVPDGLTLEQYQSLKQEETSKNQGKNLGALGPRGFKSRSMEAWQKAYEQGKVSHSFAPFNFRERLAKGELSLKDIPYMVRGGNWDNSDVQGVRRSQWTKQDREYAKGGYKKEQSVSIFGSGPGLDWTGTQDRSERSRKLFPGFS